MFLLIAPVSPRISTQTAGSALGSWPGWIPSTGWVFPLASSWGGEQRGKGKISYLFFQLLPCKVSLVWLYPSSKSDSPYKASDFTWLSPPGFWELHPLFVPSSLDLLANELLPALGKWTIFCAPLCTVLSAPGIFCWDLPFAHFQYRN